MKLLSVISLVILVSCGKDKVHYVNVPGPTSESIQSDPQVEDLVMDIIEQKNEYRDSLGQVPLAPGLTCTIHNTANGDLDISFGATAYTYSMHTEFNQPNIAGNVASNILPEILRDLYIGLNYSLRCQGFIVLVDSGRYEFTLESDDGSRLYINNTLVIDNEGQHAMMVKSGSIVLERGVYPFRLDYSQSGGGNQGLVLTSDDDLVSSLLFYR